MKQEVAQPPAANLREQQRVMERLRQEYNQVRPHESFGDADPSLVMSYQEEVFRRGCQNRSTPNDMQVLPCEMTKGCFAGRSKMCS